MVDTPQNIAEVNSNKPEGGDFLSQMIKVNAETPKRDYGGTGAETISNDQPQNSDQQEQREQEHFNEPKITGDQIQKQARAHIELFDFALAKALSLYASESSKEFVSDESEKQQLTEALADWYSTMDTPPKLPPWVMLLVVVLLVYGPKVAKANGIRKSKKKKPVAKEQAKSTTQPNITASSPTKVNEETKKEENPIDNGQKDPKETSVAE